MYEELDRHIIGTLSERWGYDFRAYHLETPLNPNSYKQARQNIRIQEGMGGKTQFIDRDLLNFLKYNSRETLEWFNQQLGTHPVIDLGSGCLCQESRYLLDILFKDSWKVIEDPKVSIQNFLEQILSKERNQLFLQKFFDHKEPSTITQYDLRILSRKELYNLSEIEKHAWEELSSAAYVKCFDRGTQLPSEHKQAIQTEIARPTRGYIAVDAVNMTPKINIPEVRSVVSDLYQYLRNIPLGEEANIFMGVGTDVLEHDDHKYYNEELYPNTFRETIRHQVYLIREFARIVPLNGILLCSATVLDIIARSRRQFQGSKFISDSVYKKKLLTLEDVGFQRVSEKMDLYKKVKTWK